MTVKEIIKAVRYCIDEEAANFSDLASVTNGESTSMDNIIRAKINDALRWVCLYAPSDMLSSSSSTTATDGVITTKKYKEGDSGVKKDTQNNILMITLDSVPLRITRVMGEGWHRGVLNPYNEDSDEFAMMYDASEKGTIDLPRVGIVHSQPPVLYIQPSATEVTVMVVSNPTLGDTTSDDTTVDIPAKAETSFIYYIAYLVMIAYENNTKAQQCYNVALQNLNLQAKNDNH